ncbi:unnamed protein product, partial [Didymodactylos carnosus]
MGSGGGGRGCAEHERELQDDGIDENGNAIHSLILEFFRAGETEKEKFTSKQLNDLAEADEKKKPQVQHVKITLVTPYDKLIFACYNTWVMLPWFSISALLKGLDEDTLKTFAIMNNFHPTRISPLTDPILCANFVKSMASIDQCPRSKHRTSEITLYSIGCVERMLRYYNYSDITTISKDIITITFELLDQARMTEQTNDKQFWYSIDNKKSKRRKEKTLSAAEKNEIDILNIVSPSSTFANWAAASSVCIIAIVTFLIAVVAVLALIPLYTSRDYKQQPSGEQYVINNLLLRVQYDNSTPFNQIFIPTIVQATQSPVIAAAASRVVGFFIRAGVTQYINGNTTTRITNLTIANSYLLNQACYRALQSSHYDPNLSACLITNIAFVNITQYSSTLSKRRRRKRAIVESFITCTTTIYYKNRCSDSPTGYGLFYYITNQNSVCRHQRLNEINSCFNSSTVQLQHVKNIVINVQATQTVYISANATGFAFGSRNGTSGTTSTVATVTTTIAYPVAGTYAMTVNAIYGEVFTRYTVFDGNLPTRRFKQS